MLEHNKLQKRVFFRPRLTVYNPQNAGEDAQKIHRHTSRGQKLDYFSLDGAPFPQRTFTPNLVPSLWSISHHSTRIR